MQQRMQDAGWEPDLERWESDEESEDSAAECDADEAAGAKLSEAQVLRVPTLRVGVRSTDLRCRYVEIHMYGPYLCPLQIR